jgi:general secretion pathway protein G
VRIAQTMKLNRNGCKRGFTLIEIAIVIAIIGTLSAIAVPKYLTYKYKAKVVVAITDIKMLEKLIALYVVDNEGQLPDSLDDLPTINGPIRDPWGNPYKYLKINDSVAAPVAFIAPVARVVPDRYREPCQPEIDIPDNGIIGKARKNFMDVPVNQDYDLYSIGEDGKTNSSFRAPVSYDDVVRAYEGQYVGIVSEL